MRRGLAALVTIALLAAGCASAPASGRSSSSAAPRVPLGTIAFSSNRLVAWDIYVIRTDGTGLTRLTHVATDGAFDPTWSPDGTKIAYAVYNGSQNNWHLWVMDADGSSQTELTRGYMPAWSPDGSEITYAIYPNTPTSPQHIYVMNADGTDRKQVTTGPGCDAFPAWEPNGIIVFERTLNPEKCAGGHDDMFAVNPDGSGLLRLTTGQSYGNPSPSPDGTRIAIQDFKRNRIEIFSAYGDATVTLVAANAVDFGSSWVDAAWSPDGKALALAGSYTGNVGLYIVNADGSGLTKVPNGEDASDPAWKPEVSA
jgi:TolB protein